MVKIFILFLILLFNNFAFARNRTEVIDEAIKYKDYKWTPLAKNLLDLKKYIRKPDGTIEIKDESDEIDDRAQVLVSADGKKTYYPEGNTSLWPFEKDVKVNGEAYAWGYGHYLTPNEKPANEIL